VLKGRDGKVADIIIVLLGVLYYFGGF